MYARDNERDNERERERERKRESRRETHLRSADHLPPNDRDLHVLDLDANEEEVDLADDNVAQAILGLVVLKLDVETVYSALRCVWVGVRKWTNECGSSG